MIEVGKLWQLEAGSKRRKLLLTYSALERDLLAGRVGEGCFQYITDVTNFFLRDPKLDKKRAESIKDLLTLVDEEKRTFDKDGLLAGGAAQEKSAVRVICAQCRAALMEILEVTPADWNFIIAPHKDGVRHYHKGVFVYLEGIRSPFNLGSIFRTAEALGAEKIFYSFDCASIKHPRAIRSAMGAISMIPSEEGDLDRLAKEYPIFALETGGEDIKTFSFPREGVVVIGSEELGISPDTLNKIKKLSKNPIVTIPMTGKKESLNVAVAFGILLNSWVGTL